MKKKFSLILFLILIYIYVIPAYSLDMYYIVQNYDCTTNKEYTIKFKASNRGRAYFRVNINPSIRTRVKLRIIMKLITPEGREIRKLDLWSPFLSFEAQSQISTENTVKWKATAQGDFEYKITIKIYTAVEVYDVSGSSTENPIEETERRTIDYMLIAFITLISIAIALYVAYLLIKKKRGAKVG